LASKSPSAYNPTRAWLAKSLRYSSAAPREVKNPRSTESVSQKSRSLCSSTLRLSALSSKVRSFPAAPLPVIKYELIPSACQSSSASWQRALVAAQTFWRRAPCPPLLSPPCCPAFRASRPQHWAPALPAAVAQRPPGNPSWLCLRCWSVPWQGWHAGKAVGSTRRHTAQSLWATEVIHSCGCLGR